MSEEKKPQNSNDKDTATVEKPLLDLKFQMGLLKLAMEQDYYCGQLVKYLYDDEELQGKNAYIFAHERLTKLFTIIAKIYKQIGTRPEMGSLRQRINEVKNPSERAELFDLLDQLVSMDLFNDIIYKEFITTFIKQVKMLKAIQKSGKLIGQGSPSENQESAHVYLQIALDDINKVSFEEDDIVMLDDVPHILKEQQETNTTKLPTGIPELDDDLLGGLPTESLVLAVGGTNVGKSIFCISLACNALRAVNKDGSSRNFKILHVNLEGQRTEAILRYTANLANVRLRDLIQQTYSKEDTENMDKAMKQYGHRLKVRNMLGFGKTIEELVAIVREEHKSFKFDMLVVDYGQLLKTQNRSQEHRLVMAEVHRGLDSIAKELSCVCITPVQATRGAQANQNEFKGRGNQDSKAPVLRSEDISESFELARVAAVIMTLNITDEEREEGKFRVFLEKQRQGVKGKTYGLLTDYPRMNLTKKFFNPHSVMMEGENPGLEEKMNNETFTPDTFIKDGGSVETQEFTEEIDKTVQNFHDKKAEYTELKEQYNELRDSEDPDPEELDKLFNRSHQLREEMINIMTKAEDELQAAHPNASDAEFEDILSQLRDARTTGNTLEIEKLENTAKRYKLGLRKEKVPK